MNCPLCDKIIGSITLLGVTVPARPDTTCACTKEMLAARIITLEEHILWERQVLVCEDRLGSVPDECQVCAAYVASVVLVPEPDEDEVDCRDIPV